MIPRAYRGPLVREGRKLDRVARARYGISGKRLLAKLLKGESGFKMGAVSSAGARGAAQFMPATRAEYVRRHGVDPWRSPAEAVKAARIYLKTAGGDLQRYNPGMASYTSYILAQHPGKIGGEARERPAQREKAPPDRLPALLAYLRSNRGDALLRLGAALRTAPTASESQAPPRADRDSSIVGIGKVAQRRFGLTVGEHPAFGGVAPVHVRDSYHYSKRAIDISGSPDALLRFDRWVARRYGRRLRELFYDRGINLKNGRPTRPIGGHGTHVHVAK